MKNVIITLGLLLFSGFSVLATHVSVPFCSDTLLLHSGFIYKVRVVKISADTIFYKTYSSEEVKFFMTDEVKSILYDDGRVVLFSNRKDNNYEQKPVIAKKSLSPKERYEQGYRDGKFYYHNRGIFWAGFAMGLFWWLYFLTLIPMAAISFTPPSAKNQISNDIRLRINKQRRIVRYLPTDDSSAQEIYEKFKDINYVRGYARAAKGKKAGKLWLGFLTGAAGSFLAFLLLYLIIVLLFLAIFI